MSTLPFRAVVIGGSGADGFRRVLTGIPSPCGYALIVANVDGADLAPALRDSTGLPVVPAAPSVRLEPDRVYVVQPDHDVVLYRGQLVTSAAAIRGVQLDRLLRSVADELGRSAVAVILRGGGTDGALGVKRIKEAGGVTLAEATDGAPSEMPRAALATGAIDQVVALDDIAAQLRRIVSAPEPIPTAEEEDDDDRADAEIADTLRDLLTLVRIRSGHDFGPYKRATLYRRIARRMQVCQTGSIAEYHRYLRDHPAELAHLLRDFLISVTNFFRDPEGFDVLAAQVLPQLFGARTADDQIRVWIPGCATGEEAYSLGMLLLEQAERHRDPPPIQLFATDIDEAALAEARAGRYPETIGVDVSPERLERFFVREAGHYRVGQELRELVLFSPHNLLRDPPFSRLDLVSCRNLLIYLNRQAQQRVLGMFHFALRPDGYLFLGSSESAESTSMFSVIEPKSRAFRRRLVPGGLGGGDVGMTTGRWYPPPSPPAPAPAPAAPTERAASIGEVHYRLVERYAPPSILINGDLDVVHLSEHAGKYLEMSGGEPTRNILRLIHPALRLELRTAIYAARQAERGTDTRRIVFDEGGVRRAIEMRVRTLEIGDLGSNAVLLYLDESEPATEAAATRTDTLIEPVVRELEDELHRTRDQLRTTIEQYETSLEELKASNEELQAINEELRSASEELETSKEELQSVNEELTTLNHELKAKIDEVSHANSDLQNLMTSTDIGVVFLDRSLNIKRFTPRALDLFNMIPSDIGRPLAHLTNRLDTDELAELALRVLQQLRTIERDVTSRDGHRYLVRILPYRSLEDRIEGVVLTFVDVSDLRAAVDARLRSEAALQTTEARLRASLRGAPIVVMSFDARLQVTWGYLLGQELVPGSMAALDLVAPSHHERFGEIVHDVLATGTAQRTELELWIRGAPRTYDVRVEATGGAEVTAIGFDISPSKEAEAALRDADRRKDEFLATLSHELRNPLTPLKVALEVARETAGNPKQLAQTLAIMERQVNALGELVDELLDLSRITQGKIELTRTPLDPAQIVEAALESTRPLLAEARHDLQVELPAVPVSVFGDLSRLTQVLVNVLTNAVKYTPAGGHVALSMSADDTRQLLTIVVRDDGVGIAADVLPRVFDIFVQSRDAIGRSRGGLGIGLNLVKRLVELHGGSVAVRSDGPNRGSEFVIELPLLRAPR